MHLNKLKSNQTLNYQQRVSRILAACAALMIVPDRLQIESGIEFSAPQVEAFARTVNQEVEQIIKLPRFNDDPVRSLITQTPSLARPLANSDTPFVPTEEEDAMAQVDYPLDIVESKIEGMTETLEYVLDVPESEALFDSLRADPRFRSVIALLGVIESKLDATERSPSGAMGPFQDMGGLQGAFGDLKTVEILAENNLLPVIDQAEYNQIRANLENDVRMDRGTLLTFLINQRDANSSFWQKFVTEQSVLLTTPETAAEIAYFYLENLKIQVRERFEIEDPIEVQNLAIMAYNSGFGNMRNLHKIMTESGETEFTTNSIIAFVESRRLQAPHEQAQDYLVKFIALQTVIQNRIRT